MKEQESPPDPPSRTPFWTKDYFFLWQGQVVSQVGDAVYILAVFWFVYRKSNSALATGLVMTFTALPFVLFGGWVGTFIDRWNRKYILIVCDLIRGLILLGVVVLAQLELLQVWHLYVSGFLISCCAVLFNPSVTASIPGLVHREHLVRANSLGEISRNLSATISPLLGGLLIATIGIKVAFLINAVSFILSGLSETLISKDAMAPSPDHQPERPSLVKNIRALKGVPKILPLITASALTNFFGMSVVLVPVLVAGAEGKSGVVFGIMSACVPLGAFTGLIILSAIGGKLNKEATMPVAVACFGVAMLCAGFSFQLFVLLPLLVAMGLSAAFSRTSYITTMQETIPRELHGRAFGVIISADMGLQPLAYLVTGVLAQYASLANTLFVFGAAVLICAFWVWRLLFNRAGEPTP